MEPKGASKTWPEVSENGLQIQTRFFVVLGCLWTPFGTLFGAIWVSWEPFGLPQAVFSAAFGSF